MAFLYHCSNKKEKNMKIYLVGGAVRDHLLGLPVQDRDWVVVGADAAMLCEKGFKPIGKDFPVFLHPKTQEEYALARTERKVGQGYAGFHFYAEKDVSLEEDLLRRDLTINAMAQDEQGNIIDPFGGQNDLKQGILRHVSPAFAEDPVRILRIARFAARYGFDIAPETQELMKTMVENGEVKTLVAERVWQEWSKGLMETAAPKMIEVLRQCGALSVLAPEIEALFGVPQPSQHHPEIDSGIHTLMVVERAAQMKLSLAERYAALLHDLGKARTPPEILPQHIGHDYRGIEPIQQINQRWKVPKACAELAELVCRLHIRIHQLPNIKHAKAVLKVLKEADAFRRPERFIQLLNVCQADAQGRLGKNHTPYPPHQQWQNLLLAAQNIDSQAIAQQCRLDGRDQEIANKIDRARCVMIQAELKSIHFESTL